MIASLLVANRGEIACRVIRTARAMGMRAVAVYSDADAKALHVRMADEAVHIGPSPAAESYLVGERIIAAAKATGAEAIHPGYGFLSENADFAQAVIDAGLVWVGPRPDSIRAMGLKDAAKTLMQDAGVPVTPGYIPGLGAKDQSPERLLAEADKIGWPVLIKAVAGGGGKGMRKVDAAAEFLPALESCRREASASFGNDAVLLEKWITSPRHIEVQVFGDTHGNVVHLFERDCSLQRRHQKVIEEAPAPGMDEATREAICAAAVRAAKAVDYVGAGTIEFIADASEGLSAERIFFMEMNTRLQVEHPVTEAITGVDLVEWQLRVASGETLPRDQSRIRMRGHAIEARLYAEDPVKGFLPSTGRLEFFDIPTKLNSYEYLSVQETREVFTYDASLRVDTGYEEGDRVSPFYDPMIAKVIALGDDRLSAQIGLTRAVADIGCWPVKTNARALHAILIQPDFVREKLSTSFIDDHIDEIVYEDLNVGARLLSKAAELAVSKSIPEGLQGFRLNADWQDDVAFECDGLRLKGHLGLSFPEASDHYFQVQRRGEEFFATSLGSTQKLTLRAADAKRGPSAADGAILAPMPGKVIAVDVGQGDAVAEGQRLLVLEAMKMEHALTAPFAGTVAELTVTQGQQVEVDALLVRVERADN